MHSRVKWLVLLFLTGVLVAEEKKEQAAQLFQTAIKLSDIRTPNSPPFRLEVHISRDNKGATLEGEYVEVWASPRQWRREITLGDYHLVEVSDASDERHGWVVEPRSRLGFGKQILEFVQFGDLRDGNLDPKKLFRVSKNGTSLTCVEDKDELKDKKITCFDGTTNLLQSVQFSHGFADEYSQYSPFGAFSFPRKMKVVSSDGWTSLELTVTALTNAPSLDAALFSVPQNAEHRPICARTIPPQHLSMPSPAYASGDSQGGDVVLRAVLDTDGRPHDITVVESLGPARDAASIQALQSWVFKPATCQGEPVAVPLEASMAFGH